MSSPPQSSLSSGSKSFESAQDFPYYVSRLRRRGFLFRGSFWKHVGRVGLLVFALLWFVHLSYNTVRAHRKEQFKEWVTQGMPEDKKYSWGWAFYRHWQFSKFTSTHFGWWMYGWQSRYNYDFRVYGKYAQGDRVVYRDLMIPYDLKDYYYTYRNAPDDWFTPTPGVLFRNLFGAVTTQTRPEVPLPPLCLHPDVPFPKFDPLRMKYTDSIMAIPEAMKSYAGYFARKYPQYSGLPLVTVYVDIWRQEMNTREEALRTGIPMRSELYCTPMLELPIRSVEPAPAQSGAGQEEEGGKIP